MLVLYPLCHLYLLHWKLCYNFVLTYLSEYHICFYSCLFYKVIGFCFQFLTNKTSLYFLPCRLNEKSFYLVYDDSKYFLKCIVMGWRKYYFGFFHVFQFHERLILKWTIVILIWTFKLKKILNKQITLCTKIMYTL